MSWSRFSRRLEDVLKTSWRFLEDLFARRLEDVLKRSWKRLEDVLKTYSQDEYTGLDQDVLKTSSEDVRLRRTYSSWSRRLQDVLKTSSEDKDDRRLQNIFKTSSSRRMFAGWQVINVRVNVSSTKDVFITAYVPNDRHYIVDTFKCVEWSRQSRRHTLPS